MLSSLQYDPTLWCPVGVAWPLCVLGCCYHFSSELMHDECYTQLVAHSFCPVKGQSSDSQRRGVDEKRLCDGAGVSVSLAARGVRDTSSALTCHHSTFTRYTPQLLKISYSLAKVKTSLQHAAPDHAELVLKKLKCLAVS